MFFIRLCLSVVRDERPASSAGLLEKFFVLAALLAALLLASFFFRTPSAETLCVFTECLTLRCFCFLSTNAVQMTPDDPDNTRSACLSSYSTFSSLISLFCQTLLDHPRRATSSIKALLIIGESFIFFKHFSAHSTLVKVSFSFSLIYCPTTPDGASWSLLLPPV